jgi:hypothetical protein
MPAQLLIFGWLSFAEEMLGQGAAAVISAVYIGVLQRFIPGREVFTNVFVVAVCAYAASNQWTVLGLGGVNAAYFAVVNELVITLTCRPTYLGSYCGTKISLLELVAKLNAHYCFLLPLGFTACERATNNNPVIAMALKQYYEQGESLSAVTDTIKSNTRITRKGGKTLGLVSEKARKNMEKRAAKKAAKKL